MKYLTSIALTTLLIFNISTASAKQMGELWTCVQNMACSGTVVPDSKIAKVTASSTLKGYNAANVSDGKETMAWCEGVAGPGIGQKVAVDFKVPVTVAGVLFSPGYAKSKEVFYNNNRIKKFTLKLGERSQQFEVKIYVLNTGDGSQNPNDPMSEIVSPQVIILDKPLTINRAEFIVDEIIPGKKFNDTCISTFQFLTSLDADI